MFALLMAEWRRIALTDKRFIVQKYSTTRSASVDPTTDQGHPDSPGVLCQGFITPSLRGDSRPFPDMAVHCPSQVDKTQCISSLYASYLMSRLIERPSSRWTKLAGGQTWLPRGCISLKKASSIPLSSPSQPPLPCSSGMPHKGFSSKVEYEGASLERWLEIR